MIGYDITEEQYKIAESNGISRRNAYQRVERYYWSIEDAITKPMKKPKSEWVNYKHIAKEHGIACSTFLSRINRQGMTPYDAATKPIMTKQESSKLGLEKRTVRLSQDMIAIGKANGLNRQAIYNRFYTYGWTVEEATTLPLGTVIRNHRKQKCR